MDIINPYIHGSEAAPAAFDGFGNRSRDFNGVDNHVSIPDFEHSLTNLSCMCWIKSTDSTYKSFFSHWDDNSNRSWLIQLDATDGLLCAVKGTGASNYKIYYTPDAQDTIADGTWHHVGFTFASNDLRLYIDGLRVPAGRISNFGDDVVTGIKNSTANILIGADIASSVPANFVDSSIADCRIYDATLTEAEITDIYNGTNITTNLVGHWLTDADNVLDAAGTNHGTNIGSKYSYDNPSPPVEFGSASRSFNGSSDYIDLGDSDDFSFGDGANDSPFSVCFWAKVADNNKFRAIGKNVIGTYEWLVATDALGLLTFYLIDGTTFYGRRYNTALPENEWLHISATYDGTGGANFRDGMAIYVNNVRVDDLDFGDNSYVAMTATSNPLEIAKYQTTYANGKMADVRLYNAGLTASQVSDLYAGTDVQTNLVGHWLTDNDDVEDKAGTNDGTNFGSTYSYDNPPMDLIPSRQASRDFSGISQHVEMSDVVSIGTGSLSWSCWFNADSVVNTRGIVRMGRASSSGNARYDGLQILFVNSKISGYLIDYNNSGNLFSVQSSSNAVVGKWYHAVVSLDANAQTLELFVDGVSEGSVSLSSIHPWDITAQDPPSIGAREISDGNFTADEFDGRIADARLYDSALTLTEVLAIYNGTTDRTNLIGQWLTNSDDVLDHAGTNDGTNNNTTYSTDSPS